MVARAPCRSEPASLCWHLLLFSETIKYALSNEIYFVQIGSEMPPHEKPEVVGAIMVLDHVGYSRQEISNILKERNINVIKSGVHQKKIGIFGREKGCETADEPGIAKSAEKSSHRKSQEWRQRRKSKNSTTTGKEAQGIANYNSSYNSSGFGGSPAKKARSARPCG